MTIPSAGFGSGTLAAIACSGAGCTTNAAIALAATTPSSASKKIAVVNAVGRKPKYNSTVLATIQSAPTPASHSGETARRGAKRSSVYVAAGSAVVIVAK